MQRIHTTTIWNTLPYLLVEGCYQTEVVVAVVQEEIGVLPQTVGLKTIRTLTYTIRKKRGMGSTER